MIDDKDIDKIAEDIADMAKEEDNLLWGKFYHRVFAYLKEKLPQLVKKEENYIPENVREKFFIGDYDEADFGDK